MGSKSKRRTARLVEQFVRRPAVPKREQKWLGERVTRPSGSALRVDREQQILFGVKILGPESLNRRRYTEQAITSGRSCYEGAKVYTDHPERKGQARKVEELLGWLINVREEQGCLYADLKYLKSHPAHAMLLEVAERNPSVLGFSHNARGDVETLDDGTEVIHQILEVISVDLVTDPATTNGLFEGRNMADPVTTKLKAWWQAVKLTEGRRRILNKHVTEMGDVYDDVDVPGEAPAATAGDSDHEAALLAGFRAAAMAIWDDEDLDDKAKLAKWKDVLAAKAKLMGKPSAGTDTEEQDDEDEDKKDDKTESRIRRLERREKAYELLEAAGLPPTDRVLVEALIGLPDEAAMGRLIEREKARGATAPAPKPAPRSGSTGGNGNAGGAGKTEDIGDWMASVRG